MWVILDIYREPCARTEVPQDDSTGISEISHLGFAVVKHVPDHVRLARNFFATQLACIFML